MQRVKKLNVITSVVQIFFTQQMCINYTNNETYFLQINIFKSYAYPKNTYFVS
jgi:hypothetical protein